MSSKTILCAALALLITAGTTTALASGAGPESKRLAKAKDLIAEEQWGEWQAERPEERWSRPRPPALGAVSPLRWKRSLSAEEFTYLRARTSRIPKVTLPSPGLFAEFWTPELSGAAYPTLEGFLTDVVGLLRQEVAELTRLGATYIQLDAPFVAVAQIIIYAGAIMVLFLFVVMLLNAPREDAAEWDRTHPLHHPNIGRFGALLAGPRNSWVFLTQVVPAVGGGTLYAENQTLYALIGRFLATGLTEKGRSISVIRKLLPLNSNLAIAQAAQRPKARFNGTAMAATRSVRRIAAIVSGSTTAMR